jgi:hypothetical protein
MARQYTVADFYYRASPTSEIEDKTRSVGKLAVRVDSVCGGSFVDLFRVSQINISPLYLRQTLIET